ncbi:MAG: M42 family metallopeptidase [Abitibacteriaceae bacterium]|nr:M42 family metallopeptidase [Abditibacteriaceae bacterium]
MKIDTQYLTDVLTQLIHTPSPVGDTARGVELCARILCDLNDIKVEHTRKGMLVGTWAGHSDAAPRGVTAHVDTLGLLVKEIKSNGRLRVAQVGSFDWLVVENEGVTIQTQSGASYRGSILFSNGSYHVHQGNDRLDSKPLETRNEEIRIDARTSSAEETRALGIEVGDVVHVDTRLEINNGFVRSRYLDDKACLACIFAALKAMQDAGQTPAQRTTIMVANYEEVCHGGAAGFPDDIAEVLAADVAPLGVGQNSNEYSCSLCVQDSDGPYDPSMGRKLRRLAAQHHLPLKPDIYPQFSSDAKAFWLAGGDAKVALIGPGTDATHGYERTHLDALIATAQLIALYLVDEE